MGNRQAYTSRLLKKARFRFYLLNDGEKALARKTVKRIIRIRHHIYKRAERLGYVQRCIDAIPACRGECCKWHFPENLDVADMAVTICSVSSEELNALEKRLLCHDGKQYCPALGKSGCPLSYESRPTVCAVSYPCFAGETYHAVVEKKQIEINRLRSVLKTLFQKERKAPGGQFHEKQV
jgi:hypothetical protein